MTKIVLIVTVAALSVVLSSTGSAQRSNGNGNGVATKTVAPPRAKTNGVKVKVFQPSAFERLWHSFATGEQGN